MAFYSFESPSGKCSMLWSRLMHLTTGGYRVNPLTVLPSSVGTVTARGVEGLGIGDWQTDRQALLDTQTCSRPIQNPDLLEEEAFPVHLPVCLPPHIPATPPLITVPTVLSSVGCAVGVKAPLGVVHFIQPACRISFTLNFRLNATTGCCILGFESLDTIPLGPSFETYRGRATFPPRVSGFAQYGFRSQFQLQDQVRVTCVSSAHFRARAISSVSAHYYLPEFRVQKAAQERKRERQNHEFA